MIIVIYLVRCTRFRSHFGVLTMVLLFVGGYDALNQVIVALGFPAVIFTLIVLIAGVKFILHRDKYDATYIEEMEEAARTTKIE